MTAFYAQLHGKIAEDTKRYSIASLDRNLRQLQTAEADTQHGSVCSVVKSLYDNIKSKNWSVINNGDLFLLCTHTFGNSN